MVATKEISTTYDLLKSKEEDIKALARIGVVDSAWLTSIKIYERFTELGKELKCKMCRYECIGDEYNISAKSVRRVVSKMKA